VRAPVRVRRPWIAAAVLSVAVTVAAVAAYVAPAYTEDAPLRREVRALQEHGSDTAVWEVGSLEPGLDLRPEAPGGWTPAPTALAASVPWEPIARPFVFRTEGPSLGPAPVSVAAFDLTPTPEGLHLRLAVVPREPGLMVRFVLPSDVVPVHSNLPGRMRFGRWTATFVAVPDEGVAWEARVDGVTAETLRETRLAVTSFRFPGGEGWQQLPGWLPQTHSVWTGTATWLVPATSGPDIAPVPPLR
jgi:hypothetical protein